MSGEKPARELFGLGELFYVFCIYIQDQSFKNFNNDTMKLSVNKAKLTGLWARNCATIQQVLILKFAFGPEKFPGFSRNGPQARNTPRTLSQDTTGTPRNTPNGPDSPQNTLTLYYKK